MRVFSERVVTPEGVVAAVVEVSGSSISDVVVGPVGGGVDVDLGERWLVPGFIDVHVHGGGGAQCNTSSCEEVVRVAAFHAAHGTTSLLATTVAAPVDELVASLSAISAARSVSGGARVLGAHLEGPFLDVGSPGAMDAAYFLAPSPEVWRRLMLAGEGCVSMTTVAPELVGAGELVRSLVDAGVVVSVGHSRAGVSDAAGAVSCGARSATHVFNAMGPLHHRSPGIAGVVLDDARVSCELICDGVHVDPLVMRLVHRCKGDAGMHLVTDAIAACGMPDGPYSLGGLAVSVVDGVARLAGAGPGASVRPSGDPTPPSGDPAPPPGDPMPPAGDPTPPPGEAPLAGSMLTMDAAVANAVRWLGVDVLRAVAMASANPARLLGLGDRLGSVAVGFDADLVVLNDDLRCCGTMVGGEWVVCP